MARIHPRPKLKYEFSKHMKLSLFLWTVLPVAASVGCTYNYRGYGYATPGMAVVAPTSYSPAPRVYSVSTSTGIVITPGETDDLSLANSIRNILAKDTHLYRNVDVSIVKGFVKLRGTVPRVQDGERLCDEITAVPGVASVENQLGITHLSM
jgi:hypothetical protein